MRTRPDGSGSWVLCPGEPLPELTPEEADATRARLLELAQSLPPWTPQLPDWRRGDTATGRDSEGVRVIAERKRLAEPS